MGPEYCWVRYSLAACQSKNTLAFLDGGTGGRSVVLSCTLAVRSLTTFSPGS